MNKIQAHKIIYGMLPIALSGETVVKAYNTLYPALTRKILREAENGK